MVNQAYPSLNDYAPSWADIATTCTIFQGSVIDTQDWASLKWDDKVTVGEQMGQSGGRVMKRTTGSVKPTASGEMYKSGYRKLVKGLMAKGLVRGNQILISTVEFDIAIQHTPPNEVEIYEVKLVGCRLLSRAGDHKEGDDPEKVAIDLNPLYIVELIDGKEVVLR